MADVTYPPLDVLKPVAENVWVVDSGPMKAMGMIPIPVRTTVIRLPGHGVMVHSPSRLTPDLRRQIEEISPIRHLVAPNIAHWTFLKDWQQALPEATTWAAPGLRKRAQVRASGLRLDHDLGNPPPESWPPELEQIAVHGGAGFCEVALHHRPSRTLILADLVQNLERQKLPALLRPLAAAAGVLAPEGRAPAYLRAVVKLGGKDAREAGRRLVGTRPDRVIFAHGRWFDRDGASSLERSLKWLTG
ncbi:DUF4336 domain-containing protein [Paracoccus benzoatiresistens]|uniref:DUF4336 domain-containing protein n=1 Tax=Paracoccus benzoatiresistens TaxID=2997341 RepID=A0ABT4J2P2_9RHOB|nr:DUF4336 domain-containing protein [Paracoccus sp. EF6]MCZ0960920.1 DUF4336 domain-containing protein [Paracoccus sp. EF6]